MGHQRPARAHLAYTALFGETETRRTVPTIVDEGQMAVSSQRVVYRGARRSVQIEWADLLELRVKPHSLLLAGPAGHLEVIVPMPHALGAVINLQFNRVAALNRDAS